MLPLGGASPRSGSSLPQGLLSPSLHTLALGHSYWFGLLELLISIGDPGIHSSQVCLPSADCWVNHFAVKYFTAQWPIVLLRVSHVNGSLNGLVFFPKHATIVETSSPVPNCKLYATRSAYRPAAQQWSSPNAHGTSSQKPSLSRTRPDVSPARRSPLKPMVPRGRYRSRKPNDQSSSGDAAQPVTANAGAQSHCQVPSHAQHHNGSQDAAPIQSSRVQTSVDGNDANIDSKDLELQTERSRFTVQIQRQEKVIQCLDPNEDGSTLFQCHTVIDQARRHIIALNPPQDQLRNLQQAMSRRQDKVLQFSLQITDLQQAPLSVQTDLPEMSGQEMQLMVHLTNASHSAAQQSVAEDQSNNAMYLQLQAQVAAMQHQMQSERRHMSSLISALQKVQGTQAAAMLLFRRVSAVAPTDIQQRSVVDRSTTHTRCYRPGNKTPGHYSRSRWTGRQLLPYRWWRQWLRNSFWSFLYFSLIAAWTIYRPGRQG